MTSEMRLRLARLKNRVLCSRLGLAVAVLLGWPVAYRVTILGTFLVVDRHSRIVECCAHENLERAT
jgi:hypothetical protein